MLVGFPPFYSDDPTITCQKIIHWKKTLRIPTDARMSAVAADLILKLLRDTPERLGTTGVDEIKDHRFFQEID